MKNSIVSMLLVLVLLVSCQSKTQKDAETSPKENVHKIEQVGIDKNGTFVVTHPQQIKEQWEKHIATKSKNFQLKDFTITKGVAQGDGGAAYYMLSATSTDNTIKAAALLKLTDAIFYFETHPDSEAYNFIICHGNCNSGCDPIVVQSDGTRYLNCSSCTDCRKNEMEIR